MDRCSRGSSPTVREGFNSGVNEPSLTVGLVPRFADLHSRSYRKGWWCDVRDLRMRAI